MSHMEDLDLYRRQHRDLLAVVASLGAQADLGSVSGTGGTRELRSSVADLSGKVMVHLQLEDRHLYPELMASQHAEVRAVAARYRGSMGALRATAEGFSRRWLRPAAIEQSPAAFAAELRALLHTLAERIASEDAELFPLAER